ncbi:MAG TPA: hypothetical protein VNL16_17810 [Chloroflexota bacterium]|nr:hypothetical protein [Chloroflexota bacterium]
MTTITGTLGQIEVDPPVQGIQSVSIGSVFPLDGARILYQGPGLDVYFWLGIVQAGVAVYQSEVTYQHLGPNAIEEWYPVGPGPVTRSPWGLRTLGPLVAYAWGAVDLLGRPVVAMCAGEVAQPGLGDVVLQIFGCDDPSDPGSCFAPPTCVRRSPLRERVWPGVVRFVGPETQAPISMTRMS